MRITHPDGSIDYIDEPVSKIVEDAVEAWLAQGASLTDAIGAAIARARMMEIEDDFFVGPRRTLKP